MPRFIFKKILLNEGEPRGDIPPQEMAAQLKRGMDSLKAAFFEDGTGRVAYERIRQSQVYQAHLQLSHNLKTLDPAALARREEKIAFWINLYNVIVIHGVIALGIRDSVKEVGNFFQGVYYRVGDYSFSPDDIEHGVLRGNRRPPYALFRRFRRGDPRLNFIVEPLDPRIHFTLVCGSSSCPFITSIPRRIWRRNWTWPPSPSSTPTPWFWTVTGPASPCPASSSCMPRTLAAAGPKACGSSPVTLIMRRIAPILKITPPA